MSITYSASPSTANATDTFYTLKGLVAETYTDLSADNYPADRIPLKDVNGYDLPNPGNQVFFKNQPVSWWINGITAGKIRYTPISNTVNWSFFDSGNQYHILYELSLYMIPARTKSVQRDDGANLTTVVYEDNGIMNMTQKYTMP
jgi:hypothetical protein